MITRTMPNLPNELLGLIFEFSYHAARKSFTPSGKSLPETCWDSPLHTPNLFPFNLASVCRLWRDILSQAPDYWTRLRFDVDREPVLPTDAIFWTQGRPVEVLVLGESPMDILPITAALLRNLHRCHSIKYDVRYSSSLPLFTKLLVLLDKGIPQLHTIELGCRTEGGGGRIPALSRNLNPPPLNNIYKLKHLALPCRMFLDTCREQPCWYERILGLDLSLTLSQYRFHSPEPEDYTFQELLDHLETMSQILSSIHLRDLSLGYQPRSVQTKLVHPIPRIVEMHNVDSALIYMYFIEASDPCISVTFDGCSVPRFSAGRRLECEMLRLQNIADRHSLFNIFSAWRPGQGTATIESCPFFDDNFLQWLSELYLPEEGENHMFSSRRFECKALVIIDCPNFTAQSLCQMLRPRTLGGYFPVISESVAITDLSVSGQVPTPSESDAEWLLSHLGDSLEWKVMGQDGEIEYDIKQVVLPRRLAIYPILASPSWSGDESE